MNIQIGMVNTESELMWGNLNGKIEKWSDMFYSIIIKVTVPGLLIINFIMSYYLYFTSDLGSDAFTLPYPFWYVTKTQTQTEIQLQIRIEVNIYFRC